MNRFFLPLLFAVTMFVSAGLLFCVQPMIAKMMLPILGGSPQVWIICMVFFQALLLLGYVWAHWISSWPQTRWQVLVQVTLILFALTLLPIRISNTVIASVPWDEDPTSWLIEVLLRTVGVPFFVLSTTAPLMQKWFSTTGHAGGKDPYFLYGASNLGSMLALLGYPLWMEPQFSLGGQGWVWAGGYAVLVLLMFASVTVVIRGSRIEDRRSRSTDDRSQGTIHPHLQSSILY